MSNAFKGDFKVTTQNILGKMEMKRLRASLMDEFPNLTKKMLGKVLPKNEEVNVLKCSNGTTLYVPGADRPPAFFDDGFGGVYPTLFTLWKLPSIMPVLETHGPVSKFLLPKERSAGADMMLPGVIVPDEGLGSVAVGQKRCVKVQGNDAPFAVGKMLVSDADIGKTGMKGKGMAVLHVYRDSLWAYGGRKVPNEGFAADEISAATWTPAADDEEDEEDDEAGGGERRSGEERLSRTSGPIDPIDEMAPDALMEYCFYAAFKTSCTDAVIGKGITVDDFYSKHMQPSRPAGQPKLDAKNSSYKQIGKFIKHMHKQKAINVRDVKNTITILSVDRACAPYTAFELQGGASAQQAKEVSASAGDAKGGGGGGANDDIVPLRTKPPVVTDVWQPNSYTKPLFKAAGKDHNGTYSLQEIHNVLETYIATKLSASLAAAAAGEGGGGAVDVTDAGADGEEASAEVAAFLRRAGLDASAASAAATALAADGFDSIPALRAAALEASEYDGYGVPSAAAGAITALLKDGEGGGAAIRAWVQSSGVAGVDDKVAAALVADGFDSVDALAAGVKAGQLTASELESRYAASSSSASGLAEALKKLSVSSGSSSKDAGSAPAEAASATGAAPKPSGSGAGDLGGFDPNAIPLDDLLLTGLVKLAGGVKKGATFATHMPLAELKAAMTERMSAFHQVTVEGEAPSVRKGALKLITVEMKRAAGHNKTHIAGLESFCISPDAVAQALKIKLGCTTAVLKLPGNNTKDMEVLLQGHCVQEVCDYLRDVYCIDKQWLELKLKESKRSNT